VGGSVIPGEIRDFFFNACGGVKALRDVGDRGYLACVFMETGLIMAGRERGTEWRCSLVRSGRIILYGECGISGSSVHAFRRCRFKICLGSNMHHTSARNIPRHIPFCAVTFGRARRFSFKVSWPVLLFIYYCRENIITR